MELQEVGGDVLLHLPDRLRRRIDEERHHAHESRHTPAQLGRACRIDIALAARETHKADGIGAGLHRLVDIGLARQAAYFHAGSDCHFHSLQHVMS